jgi:hypothetical protein
MQGTHDEQAQRRQAHGPKALIMRRSFLLKYCHRLSVLHRKPEIATPAL